MIYSKSIVIYNEIPLLPLWLRPMIEIQSKIDNMFFFTYQVGLNKTSEIFDHFTLFLIHDGSGMQLGKPDYTM